MFSSVNNVLRLLLTGVEALPLDLQRCVTRLREIEKETLGKNRLDLSLEQQEHLFPTCRSLWED